MNGDTAEIIKQAVPIRRVVEQYGYHVDPAGKMLCPFHQEKTPSFKIYDGDRGYHCFGCGKSGDVLSFVRELTGLPFPDVVKALNDDFHLGLNVDKPSRDELQRLKRERERAEASRDAEKARYWSDVDEWLEQLEKYEVIQGVINTLQQQFRAVCFDPAHDDPFSDQNAARIRQLDRWRYELACLDAFPPQRGEYHF